MVTFDLKDKKKFNMEQVKEALKGRGYFEVELISCPGPKERGLGE